jgi:hypothetical protein
MFYRQFYSELGKLLYALASVDGVISDKEKAALKDFVRKDLVPNEKHTDKFGTDAAYYIEIEFDILEDAMPDTEATFDSFLEFIERHYTAIDKRMRDDSIRIAVKVANAFHKTSKKEKALIETLKKKLSALPATA